MKAGWQWRGTVWLVAELPLRVPTGPTRSGCGRCTSSRAALRPPCEWPAGLSRPRRHKHVPLPPGTALRRYTRMEALEAVCCYHSRDFEAARKALVQAKALWQKLQVRGAFTWA
jgi:hypothetical protein